MRRHVVALGAIALAGSLSLVWLSSAGAFGRLPVARPIVVTEAYRYRADTLHRNEVLGTLFERRGVPAAEVSQILAEAPSLNPRRARAGQRFSFRYVIGDSQPEHIDTRLNRDSVLHLYRESDRWRADIEDVFWQVDRQRVEGVMSTSLYESLHDAIPDSVLPPSERERFIADLADGVFGWEIDFSRDIVKGDHFSLVYDRLTSSLHDVRYGRLLAAKIEARRQPNTAYLFPDSSGRNAYYDEQGNSLQRTFLKKPVAFLRISSGFTNRRFHPVLGIFRAHRGTDYAARYGTEIYATADGVVRLAGREGGYGLMIAIRHPRSIETRYAHMSRIRARIKRGARVRQGEVIGYVGATGLASGPHVHYEFLKNGRQVNALKVDLGKGHPLPESRRRDFARLKVAYEQLLASPVPPSVAVRGN
ncbi:MAG: M23 family metallopeptidase [Gemmatimonadetes bacterium]|nr:M23 family metallopeptidase [Gemmatimonadota bacterium]